ncbi:hypothetical protein IEQ34_005503 [Dendrobium chrysotoxum]|uniref:Uncharacterized protein n=1 Tax=Dendrobium chrysotoxum TaxID=161865 RepID=A0AAV7HB86_DENCH|nr:hypothetical protein IEQ34_005503 [Dendrobium chrysotoxum]
MFSTDFLRLVQALSALLLLICLDGCDRRNYSVQRPDEALCPKANQVQPCQRYRTMVPNSIELRYIVKGYVAHSD